MDTRNATEFIASYNKIDAQLRELYGFKPSQPFTDVVRRSAEKNAIVRRYENELADYARLRNAIVHQSTDGRIIAVPCDDVVESIQLIERLLCSPPTVGETLQDKRIVSIEAEISLKQAVMLMARTGYSNIPVYRGKRMIGIANNRRILRELGGVLARGLSADAWLGGTAVSDILSESDLFVYYKYIGKKDSLQEIVDAFEENRKLLAVCVVNFITAADLPHLNKLLEDYK